MEAKKKNTGRKMIRYPDKRGINLIQNDEKNKHLIITIVVTLLVIILLEIGLKFGVLDLYSKLNTAGEDYDIVHVQYVAAQNELRDYDDVLMEYRTYSMDWMKKDTSGKYVAVDRRDILDLIESKMMKVGRVESFSVSGSDVRVEMSGMNLKQISQMCAELEGSSIVDSAILMSAGTDKKAVEQRRAAEAAAAAAEAEEAAEEAGVDTETAKAVVKELAEEEESSVEKGDELVFNILIRLRAAEKEG